MSTRLDLRGLQKELNAAQSIATKNYVIRGLGYGDMISELVPEEVSPMIITDCAGKPKVKLRLTCQCHHCGTKHPEDTQRCSSCASNDIRPINLSNGFQGPKGIMGNPTIEARGF